MAELNGYQKRKAKGLRHVLLTFTPEEMAVIEAASKADGRTRAGWLRHFAIREATIIAIQEDARQGTKEVAWDSSSHALGE